ncbi:MAG TPA: NADH:flavin oxidoreductase/NADH oxidase [Solimonas sp.]|nr:NADH:flavin oxidoreductase/NADH oxidase [Solimonas sp.]
MKLFHPLTLRGITLRNRIGVSPMCQYSAVDGLPSHWHLVHLGSRAVGGAGLVIAEASAVAPEGRISPADTGLWNEAQAEAWAPITRFIREAGAVPGIQLAHAGRKASTDLPWRGGKPLAPEAGGWSPVVSASALAFAESHPVPQSLSQTDIAGVVAAFGRAARLAREAGFEFLEIHAAHGYLLHQFLSPLSNWREDAYGGSLDGRMRLTLEVIAAVRREWPERLPLSLRLSATDWAESGGWDLEQSIELVRRAMALVVDVIDVSSGGSLPNVRIPVGPGFQVPFARRIREETGAVTAAVGLISDPAQAQQIISTGDADLVLLGREFLRDPYWPQRAARALGARIEAPLQYQRAL